MSISQHLSPQDVPAGAALAGMAAALEAAQRHIARLELVASSASTGVAVVRASEEVVRGNLIAAAVHEARQEATRAARREVRQEVVREAAAKYAALEHDREELQTKYDEAVETHLAYRHMPRPSSISFDGASTRHVLSPPRSNSRTKMTQMELTPPLSYHLHRRR